MTVWHQDEADAPVAEGFAVLVRRDDGKTLRMDLADPASHDDEELGPCDCAGCMTWHAVQDLVAVGAERVNAFGQRILSDAPELPGDRWVNAYRGWSEVHSGAVGASTTEGQAASTAGESMMSSDRAEMLAEALNDYVTGGGIDWYNDVADAEFGDIIDHDGSDAYSDGTLLLVDGRTVAPRDHGSWAVYEPVRDQGPALPSMETGAAELSI